MPDGGATVVMLTAAGPVPAELLSVIVPGPTETPMAPMLALKERLVALICAVRPNCVELSRNTPGLVRSKPKSISAFPPIVTLIEPPAETLSGPKLPPRPSELRLIGTVNVGWRSSITSRSWSWLPVEDVAVTSWKLSELGDLMPRAELMTLERFWSEGVAFWIWVSELEIADRVDASMPLCSSDWISSPRADAVATIEPREPRGGGTAGQALVIRVVEVLRDVD